VAAISVNVRGVPALQILWNCPTYDITHVHLTVRHVWEDCTVIHVLHWRQLASWEEVDTVHGCSNLASCPHGFSRRYICRIYMQVTFDLEHSEEGYLNQGPKQAKENLVK